MFGNEQPAGSRPLPCRSSWTRGSGRGWPDRQAPRRSAPARIPSWRKARRPEHRRADPRIDADAARLYGRAAGLKRVPASCGVGGGRRPFNALSPFALGP